MGFFRVPETLEPDDDALELLNDFIGERGNKLGIQADDVAGLAQCVLKACKLRGTFRILRLNLLLQA